MMQSNMLQRSILGPAKAAVTSKVAASGQIFQVRNHVKMYPWRSNRNIRESYLDNTRTPYTDKHNINEFKSTKFKLKSWQKVVCKDQDVNAFHRNDAYTSNPREAKETAQSKLNRLGDSLRSRGHARERLAYNPPADVEEKIVGLCNSVGLKDNASLDDRELKFRLISGCMEIFNHDLPSSYLNDMITVRDVIDYFSTEVRGVNPYEALVSKANDLPPNLAILGEPKRYDRDNAEFFKGHNAMPGLISKVPGLRAEKKYRVLNQDEFQWPDI